MRNVTPRLLAIPDQFWEHPDVHAALARRGRDGSRDIGALLRLVNRRTGTSQSKIGAAVGLEQGYVSKVMSGQRVIVSIDVLERLADGLAMPDAARILLGLAPRRMAWQGGIDVATLTARLDPVPPGQIGNDDREDQLLDEERATNRRQLLGSTAAVAASVFLDRLWSEPGRMHEALDAATISPSRLAELQQEAARLAVQVVRVPPASLITDTLAYFRYVRRLAATKQTLTAQRELTRCGAMFGTVMGEILFNQGQFPLSRQWYAIARRSAMEVSDQYLADVALAGSTYLLTYTPDPRGVLDNVALRLGTSHKASPAIAWLWGFQAKAHAALGNRTAFEKSIESARKALNKSSPKLIKPGIFSFVPEKLAFYEAHGWVELNNTEAASAAAERAIGMYDLTETTEPALVRFEQASAYAQIGELAEACRIATSAVLDRHTYHGITVISRAKEFDRLLGSSSSEPVRDWRNVLSTLRAPRAESAAAPDET